MAYLTDDSVVSRIYSNFRGADFRGDEINLVRSPDCLNVWKDYRETESIRTRPELALKVSLPATVYGVFFYHGTQIVHSGKNLYTVSSNGDKIIIFSAMNKAPSSAFVFEDIFYIKDGVNYLQYDGTTISEVVGYIPTTTIARNPSGGGTVYEDVNMLSDYRYNSFLADGGSLDFYLDVTNIDDDFVPVVTVDGAVVSTDKYTVDYVNGQIKMSYAPDAPLTDGQDNVKIKFKKALPKYKASILGCTLLQVFDNRVFVSGNKDFPNVVWHCSLNDPSYFSDLDYYREGQDEAPIKGIVAGNNALWVFRESSDANTNVFYHTPTLDDEYGKVYPSSHSSITTGCVGGAINFGDDICFFSERGMEGISGDITTEQAIAHRSSLVDRKLLAEQGYKNMILAEWEGYLFIFIGNHAYLADSRTAFTNEGHIEYEWFLWHLPKAVTCARVHDGILYVGSTDGIYAFTDYESDVESWWTTPLDKFKHPHKMKTTNKRGGVAEAKGKEIFVYAKTNKEADWDLIGTYYDVTDAFVYRIKKKKFKDLRLKFYSPKRFSLESATLEVFVGGYLKNL